MPLYEYQCGVCGSRIDIVSPQGGVPFCCKKPMTKIMSAPAFFKMKGMGGYPSRRKQFTGTAPGTTSATRPNRDVVMERLFKKT